MGAVKDNFEVFGLNLRKLPNYVRYFVSYNVEGVAESWMGAGAWFSNTYFGSTRVTSVSWQNHLIQSPLLILGLLILIHWLTIM